MIRYDQSATFVDIPLEIAFENIIDGERPATAKVTLQEPCAVWCAENLCGNYGISSSGRWSRHYTIWFELLTDATLFKLRWFSPPPEQSQ